MSCKDSRELIDAYEDGELDLAGNLEIEQHLQSCRGCSQAYKNHQALRSAIRSGSLYFDPPVNLEERIRSALRKSSKIEVKPGVLSWRWLSFAASAALIAIVIWNVLPGLIGPYEDDFLTQEIISGHVRSLMADHLTDVQSSDQHTVKPWFNGKLDFSPEVKDLSEHGFSLVGGRLDYLENKPVAALVYQRRKHLINLFIWPTTQETELGKKMESRQGYNLIRWTKSDMNYVAVSDLNTTELQEFVQLIQNQAPTKPSP